MRVRARTERTRGTNIVHFILITNFLLIAYFYVLVNWRPKACHPFSYSSPLCPWRTPFNNQMALHQSCTMQTQDTIYESKKKQFNERANLLLDNELLQSNGIVQLRLFVPTCFVVIKSGILKKKKEISQKQTCPVDKRACKSGEQTKSNRP